MKRAVVLLVKGHRGTTEIRNIPGAQPQFLVFNHMQYLKGASKHKRGKYLQLPSACLKAIN